MLGMRAHACLCHIACMWKAQDRGAKGWAFACAVGVAAAAVAVPGSLPWLYVVHQLQLGFGLPRAERQSTAEHLRDFFRGSRDGGGSVMGWYLRNQLRPRNLLTTAGVLVLYDRLQNNLFAR